MASTWLSTDGGSFPEGGPQNARPMVWLSQAQDAEHVWLTDPNGYVVDTERVEGEGWIQLHPTKLLEPGLYSLHAGGKPSRFPVHAGVDHLAPQASATFTASGWAVQNDRFHLALSGEKPQDESAVALQVQVWSPEEPVPPVERVDGMSRWAILSQIFPGELNHTLLRARWIDAAGNKTAWSTPQAAGDTVYDQKADVARQLRVACVGVIPLLAALLASAILQLRTKRPHRSPVGLHRPIPPGPR
ncbi:MAG: hypothetical protein ACI9VR_004828 [Cognaticolwellia sp.]